MSDAVSFRSTFFTVSKSGSVHVVTINRDHLSEDDNIEQFGQDFNLLIEKHEINKIALVLNHVLCLSSSFIGKLIGIHRKLNRSGGMLVLTELTPDVANTLETARLLTYFHHSKDLPEAIAMLRGE